jgi:hypothetical protein
MNATIDGVEVQLLQAPGFSYSLMDFIDSSRVKGNKATTIEVVATNDARRVLGSRQQSERAAKEHEVIIGTPGATYWRSRIRPVRWTADVIECEAVGGNATWIESVKGQKLKRLKFGLSRPVTSLLQRQSWTDENSILHFPLIDYGSFEGQPNFYNVAPVKLRPAVRVWRVLTQAFSELGVTIKARGSFATFWKKLILPNVKDDLQSEGCPDVTGDSSVVSGFALDIGGITVGINYPYPASDPGTIPPRLPWINEISDPINGLVPPPVMPSADGFRFVVPSGYGTQVTVSICRLFVGFQPGDRGRTIRIAAWNLTTNTRLDSLDFTLTSFSFFHYITHRFAQREVSVGDEILVGIERTEGPPMTLTVIRQESQASFDMGTPDNEINASVYAADAPVIISTACPDMTTAELIKDLVTAFDLVVTTDPQTGVVYFETYEDHLLGTDRGSDWRGREAQPTQKEQPPVPLRYSWTWAPDSEDKVLQELVRSVAAPGYGNGDYFPADGWDKPVEIKMTFAATAMINIFGFVFVPCMRKEDGEVGEDNYNYKPRILFADGVTPGEWRHDSLPLTDYPKVFFVRPGEPKLSLAFGQENVYGQAPVGTIERYHRPRLRRIETATLLRLGIRFGDDELISLDMRKPVYVNDGFDDRWYYIMEIRQKRFGVDEYTEVELIQV